jgi:hypothetical protein
LKDLNPIELALYAQMHNLLQEPAFAWWAKEVLERKQRIINKVKSQYWQRTHKLGICLPKTIGFLLAALNDLDILAHW